MLTKKDAKSQLLRWTLLLQEFNLEICDKKGTKNVVTDHLSKLSNSKYEDVPINNDFLYDRLIAFIRAEAPYFAHFTDYLEESNSGMTKELEEVDAQA